MKINSFVLGLAAASISASQDAKAQTLMTRVYHEDDFRGYYLFYTCRIGFVALRALGVAMPFISGICTREPENCLNGRNPTFLMPFISGI